jgi:capsular polysaccharide biosynthesis protein
MDKDCNDIKAADDEINLYDLWRVLVKRKGLIIAVFLVAVISAAVISSIMPKIYQGETVLVISKEDITVSKDMPTNNIAKLQELIPASVLISMISPITKEKIRMISPQNSDSIVNVKPVELKGSTDKFNLIVESTNPGEIKDFVKDFVVYLNNHSVIRKSVEECRAHCTRRLVELTKVIDQSEMIKKRYEKMLTDGKLTVLGFSPVSLEKQVADLKIEKFCLEERLKSASGIDFANGMTVSDRPIRPRIKMNIVLAGLASLFIGIFLAFFLEFIKKMKGKSRE